MSNKATSQALSDHWRQHIEDWRTSGVSQQAFCRERNLSFNQFHYWRKKRFKRGVNCFQGSL
jgi:hypothetical protein